jgi:hypothetical protein
MNRRTGLEKETRKRLWVAHFCSAVGVSSWVLPILIIILSGHMQLGGTEELVLFLLAEMVLIPVGLVLSSAGFWKYGNLLLNGVKSCWIYVLIVADAIVIFADTFIIIFLLVEVSS